MATRATAGSRAAAGTDNELDADEFRAAAGETDSFVRAFDSWSEMLKFDKDRNGAAIPVVVDGGDGEVTVVGGDGTSGSMAIIRRMGPPAPQRDK